MANEIQDGSLSWEARIDTSKLAGDIKSIADLLSQVGGNIDVSEIDAILKQQAEKEVDIRKDIAQQVAKINEDVAAQAITVNSKVFDDAKQKAGDLKNYIESIPFEIKTGGDKQLSQAEIDAINSKNTGIPISNKSPDFINKPSASSFESTDAINQARDAYNNADAATKQYLDDLTSLEFQLQGLKKAQTDLNVSFRDGKVNEQDYLTQSSQLKAGIEGVTNELSGVKAAQNLYTQSLSGESVAVEKNVTILTEYRRLRNQIAADKINGIVNEADVERATELEHAIRAVNNELHLASSNTAFIEAASEGIRGMVGAFSALSGVVGLFTKDNETANKIMQDTISFLGIINGLEQISQVLATNGKLNLYINNLLRRNAVTEASTAVQVQNNVATVTNTAVQDVNIVSTEANAVAKATEATATEGATVAQEGLNIAMSANPAAILLLAITAIISAYELFAEDANKAAEAQQKLNQALDLAKFYSDDALDTIKRFDAETISEMKAQGKSAQEIRDTEKKQLEDQYDVFVQHNQTTIEEGKKASEKLAELQKNNGKIITSFEVSDPVQGTRTVTKETEASDDYINNLKATVDKAAAIAKEKNQLASDIRIKANEDITADNEEAKKAADKANEDAKKAQQKALANDVEYWQAKVELARKGTQEWLDAQLKLNEATADRALKTGTNPIKVNADKIIADNTANDTFRLQSIQDTQDIISGRLDIVAKGSHEELALRLQQLEQEKQAAIINAHNNVIAIEKINADSLKKQSDLKKQFAETDAKTFEDIQQNQLKIILSDLSEGTAEYLKFSKESANQNAASSITDGISKAAAKNPAITSDDIALSATFNEKSALAFADRIESIDKDLAVKIRAIWAETNAKNQQSTNTFINQQIANKSKLIDVQTEIQKEVNNAIINNPNASPIENVSAQINNNRIDVDAEKNKIQAISDELAKKYPEASDAVSKYVQEVEKDFTKIKDLSDDKSDIFKAFDKIKDPELRNILEEDLTKLSQFKKESVKLQENEKPQAIAKQFGQVGDIISNLGSDISSLNSDLGETLQTVGSIVSQLANIAVSALSGNVLGVVTGAIGLIGSVIKELSPDAATHQFIAKYQQDLATGQIKYNEELLTTKKIQDDITRGMIDQLNAQIQLNNEKKTGYQTDLDSLTQILEQQGKYINSKFNADGSINKDFKGIGLFKVESLGIDSSMTDDQIAALLREKEATNQLTDSTKQIADQWLAVYDNINNATEQSAELKEQLTEAFAGTTADDIAKSIVDGLQQGKVAAAQWGEDFNKIISNALLSSITNTLESGAVNKIWQTLQANINADGSVTPLSPEEIETLRKQYSDAVDQGNALLQQAESIFPDLASTLDNSNTLAGAIQGSLTEDTANELAGLFRNQLDTSKQSLNIAISSLAVHQQIEANTANALVLFSAHLPMLTMYLPFLKNINDNTVPEQLKRDFGL